MMIRKIWWFLWYQNRNNFEKNEKRKDQAPLMFVYFIMIMEIKFDKWMNEWMNEWMSDLS